MSSIRRHLSYANVVATMALLFAMSGSALAVGHYIISSTRQIKPSVLKQLKGNAGRTGPQGPAGTPGAAGAPGAPGVPGTPGDKGPAGLSATSALPSGQSESGDYGFLKEAEKSEEKVDAKVLTFPVPLAGDIPENHVIYTTAKTGAPHCAAPGQAERGYMCIYSSISANVTALIPFSYEAPTETGGTGRLGVILEWQVKPKTSSFDYGTYTITAP